eukprot:TRINITY_DN11980_c0_g1_i1.p1 TRINITY_DN11980_c0_g1~~TRINITY_DN11980_c0_g1_i1.p1  ORF type:complete len:100 (+),score=24.53 TRINITY_DN11980_c0_g1_i1:64-363(+)
MCIRDRFTYDYKSEESNDHHFIVAVSNNGCVPKQPLNYIFDRNQLQLRHARLIGMDQKSEVIVTYTVEGLAVAKALMGCLLYTSPSPRDGLLSRMPSSA